MGKPRDNSRHSYERCIACGRSFLVYRSRLLQTACKFCSQRCFWQSWRAFSRLPASGQLEGLLEMPIAQEVLNPDAPATRRRMHW
jgi:hypothetical protein